MDRPGSRSATWTPGWVGEEGPQETRRPIPTPVLMADLNVPRSCPPCLIPHIFCDMNQMGGLHWEGSSVQEMEAPHTHAKSTLLVVNDPAPNRVVTQRHRSAFAIICRAQKKTIRIHPRMMPEPPFVFPWTSSPATFRRLSQIIGKFHSGGAAPSQWDFLLVEAQRAGCLGRDLSTLLPQIWSKIPAANALARVRESESLIVGLQSR